jgi:hypothetical protein
MGFNKSVGEGNADDRLSEGQKGETSISKEETESSADEVKLLKRGGLVGGDSALDSEMLNPQCLEPAQCPVAVASGIQTASSECWDVVEESFGAITSGPQLGDYAQADEELDVLEEGFGAANLGSGLEKGDFASEPLDLELDEISRDNSTGAESLNSPHASKLQNGSLDELEVHSIVLDFFFCSVFYPLQCVRHVVWVEMWHVLLYQFLNAQRQMMQV